MTDQGSNELRGGPGQLGISARSQAAVVAGQAVKMAYAVAALKIISVRFGLESLGQTGQLLSLTSIMLILAIAGTSRALTHAHASSGEVGLHPLEANLAAYFVSGAATMATGIALFAFRGWIATEVLGEPSTSSVLAAMAALTPLFAFNGLGVAIASAHGRGTQISAAMAAASLAGLGVLVLVGGESLQLNMLVLVSQGPMNFAALWFLALRDLAREGRLATPPGAYLPTRASIARLATYSVIIVLPVLFQQLQRILGRRIVLEELGAPVLGLWEAVIKLQEGYIQLVASVLVLLLLPRFVGSPASARAEAIQFARKVSAALLLACAVTLPFGGQILSLLYSPEAAAAQTALVLNIGSDILRSSYTALQFVLLAKERFKAFVAMELLSAASLLGATAIGASTDLNRIFVLYAVQGVLVSAIALRINTRKSDS